METIVKGLLILSAVVLLFQCKKDLEPEFAIKDNNFLDALIAHRELI
jgi:hypothetical protein